MTILHEFREECEEIQVEFGIDLDTKQVFKETPEMSALKFNSVRNALVFEFIKHKVLLKETINATINDTLPD